MTNAVAVREERALTIQALVHRKEDIAKVLPPSMSAERFIQVTWLAIAKNPDLLECTPESIIASVIEAAEVGLEPTGSLSRAWLIPYSVNVAEKNQRARYVKKAQLQIGYQGLADLARNSGVISKVESRVVYQGEVFEVDYGTNPKITHIPDLKDHPFEEIAAFYAIAYFRDGTPPQFDAMTRQQVDGIRARSKAANFGPWVTDYPEMGRKTIVKRLMKSLPLSPEAQLAIQKDNEAEVSVAPGPTVSRTAQLAADLRAKVGAPDPETPTDAGDEVEGEVAEVVSDESAPQQTPEPVAEEAAVGQAGVAGTVVCGNRASEGLMEGTICLEPAGHKGAHKSANGSWPA